MDLKLCNPPVMCLANGCDDCVARLRIAFKWMVRAFSGYLSTDQLLLLWDRILGYDSLEVVAGIALALSYKLCSKPLYLH